jgi:carbamate kinase
VETYPLDVLDAQTEGMIGYLIEQELGNLLPAETSIATLLTMIEVDPRDPAFGRPTKPIGPIYNRDQADRLAESKGWVFHPDGDGLRRVVPSPRPQRIIGLRPIEWLIEQGCVVICAGGGGIPTMYSKDPSPAGRRLVGVEGVIDKDHASARLAADIDADMLVIATDVDALYLEWGEPTQRAVTRANPEALAGLAFSEGSMGPKVQAACAFAQNPGRTAAIGQLSDIEAMLRGDAGTIVSLDAAGVDCAQRPFTGRTLAS